MHFDGASAYSRPAHPNLPAGNRFPAGRVAPAGRMAAEMSCGQPISRGESGCRGEIWVGEGEGALDAQEAVGGGGGIFGVFREGVSADYASKRFVGSCAAHHDEQLVA